MMNGRRWNRTAVMVLAMVMTAWPAGIGSAAAQPQEETCSASALSGAYGFSITGTNYASDVSWALVGRFSADGVGVFDGSGTQSVKGKIGRVKFTGKYEVRADCSGSATLQFIGGPPAALDFVVVDNGQEVHLIVADQGTLETGVAKKVRGVAPVSGTTAARPASR